MNYLLSTAFFVPEMNYLLPTAFFVITVLVVVLFYKLRNSYHLNQTLAKDIRDITGKMTYCRTLLDSRSRDTQVAEDRAKKNQDRWIRFRNEMVRLYAMHEFIVNSSSEAHEEMNHWEKLTVGEQYHWINKGRDFVEHNYGSLVG